MKRQIPFFAILLFGGVFLVSCSGDDPAPFNPIDVPEGYSLVWQDEFDNGTIDPGKWVYETGDGTEYDLPVGWGNNELQIYTDDPANSVIEEVDGTSALNIRALSDGAGGYTSAKLTTQGRFSMRFGRVEVRAKLPKGQGIWPAIWMLGDNKELIDWPGCGEIDIVELLGHEPHKVYSTVHYTNGENKKGESQDSLVLQAGDFSEGFQVFSLDWTPEALTFAVNGVEIHSVPIEADMKEFLRSFYLILNVAVGGYWPGNPDNSTTFPQTLCVDYVRVFEKNGFTLPDAPALDLAEETIGQPLRPSLAQHAIRDDFTALGNAEVVVWGGGGEPLIEISDLAIDGDSSLVYAFPGGNWGGAYMELETPRDLSGYSYLRFSLHAPAALADAEIKLESPRTNATIFLKDYSGSDAGQGFVEYQIPLTDFSGLELREMSIPFAMWNPRDANGDFVAGQVLIDNLYFSN